MTRLLSGSWKFYQFLQNLVIVYRVPVININTDQVIFKNVNNPNSVIDFDIVDYKEKFIYIRVNSINPSSDIDYLKAQIILPDSSYHLVKYPILIKKLKADSAIKTLKINFTSWCRPEYKTVMHTKLTLYKNEDNTTVAKAFTSISIAERKYQGQLIISDTNFLPGQTFYLKAEEFPDLPPPKINDIIGLYSYEKFDNYLPLIIPENNSNSPFLILKDIEIIYPQCRDNIPPLSSESNITDDKTFYYVSPIPAPSIEPQSTSTNEFESGILQTEAIQITISNYDDFRLYNDPDDQGTTTMTISNPNEPQNLEWIAKTTGSEKRLYVREIYSDQTFKDYWITVSRNEESSFVGKIQLIVKIVKKVVKISIGDKEINIENPQIPLDLHLPGIEGQGQQFKIPVVITYSDGSTLYTALTFNYNPPPPTPAPVARTCPYEEAPQGCPYGGARSCTGIYRDDVCVYDESGQVPPNCRETCNPAPGNICAYTESFNCTGQNAGCGPGSGEMRKTIINTDCRESSISYCDSSCAPSGGGGSGASCPESYPECRGANTFWITPECDGNSNIINYNAEDLGDLGQCQ